MFQKDGRTAKNPPHTACDSTTRKWGHERREGPLHGVENMKEPWMAAKAELRRSLRCLNDDSKNESALEKKNDLPR